MWNEPVCQPFLRGPAAKPDLSFLLLEVGVYGGMMAWARQGMARQVDGTWRMGSSGGRGLPLSGEQETIPGLRLPGVPPANITKLFSHPAKASPLPHT